MSLKLAVDAALSSYWQQAVAARQSFELGLLLGVSTGGAAPAHALLTGVRVPSESEDDDSRGFEDVSADWTQEFAKQVDRLLPGGMSVVGVYVLSAAPARPTLEHATLYLRAVADALRVPQPFAALVGPNDSETPQYIVHVCATSGQLSARSVAHVLEANRTSAAAVDVRIDTTTVALTKVTATVAVDEPVAFARHEVVDGSDGRSVVERVVAALEPQLVPLAARVCAATAVSRRRRKGEDVVVQFLTQVHEQHQTTATPKATTELLRGSFRGSVSCVAYFTSLEDTSTAVAASALKRDFLKSLLLRVELVAERWADTDALAPLSAANGAVGTLPFPRRASLPWSSSLGACSHFPALLHVFSDGHELAAQSALEILGSSDDAAVVAKELAFLEAEPVASPQEQQRKSESNPLRTASLTTTAPPGSASSSGVLVLALAVLCVLVAIVVQQLLL